MSEKIVQLNEEVIEVELKELVRSSVEETRVEMYLTGDNHSHRIIKFQPQNHCACPVLE